MTELSKEEKNVYWTTIKTGWKKIKDQSISEAYKSQIKKDIIEARKSLGLDETVWDQKKTSRNDESNYEPSAEVNWNSDSYPVDSKEIERYQSIICTAYYIVKTRHPKMDPDSNTFGTIVSAVTGHLIALRS